MCKSCEKRRFLAKNNVKTCEVNIIKVNYCLYYITNIYSHAAGVQTKQLVFAGQKRLVNKIKLICF